MRGIIASAAMLLLGALVAVPQPASAAGTLRVAVQSNLNTLDPAKTKIGEEYIVDILVYSGLTELDSHGRARPDLAERWTTSPDQKTWTFYLRKDAKFHNGRPVDAQDVIETVKRILDPATGSPYRANFQIVDKMEALDPHTVRFELKIPYAGFADIFGDRQARIVPRDALNTLSTHPIGSGPFMFQSYEPGNSVVLVRNPNYYVPGVPKLDKVVLRIIPEGAAAVSALETGEVDLLWNLPLESIGEIKKNPDLVVDSVPTSTWDGLIMNCSQKPFTDQRVRRAVELAIDKNAMVQLALFGNGTPTHTMIPPSSPFYNSDIKIGPPDIAGAKKLLAEAGYANGFDITLYVPAGRPTRERLGLAAREMLKPIGIKVAIQTVPWDKFISDIEGKATFYTDGFFSRPTIDTSVYPFFDSNGSWNSTLWHYKNPEIDKVLDAARGARSEEEQAKLYKQFQVLALEDPPGVIAYVQNHVNAYRKNVKGFHSSPMLWLDLRQVTVQ
ncbi:MAG TPA: ABC transporter substrate-binding protein [Alphaproteobacteria bacterium]|nr:ABC transporter substrate-binding protein [Alphaproteobacteria bacterium]